jgi:hypothetical protein
MNILSIDPGSRYTGVVIYDSVKDTIPYKNAFENDNEGVIALLRSLGPPFQEHIVNKVVIEGVKSYGQIVGDDVFETLMWIGEFRRVCKDLGLPYTFVIRKTYVTHLTGNPRSKDTNVRACMIERWGYQDIAIGGRRCKKCNGNGVVGRAACPVCGKASKKPCCGKELVKETCPQCGGSTWEYPPGPLYGVVDHMWPALAMAVYISEVEK